MTPEQMQEEAQAVYGDNWRKDLAKDTGYSIQTVYAWHSGKHKIPPLLPAYLGLKLFAKTAGKSGPITILKKEK
jgi:hypothetical protein